MEYEWEDRGKSVNEGREECDLGESGERVVRKKEKGRSEWREREGERERGV